MVGTSDSVTFQIPWASSTSHFQLDCLPEVVTGGKGLYTYLIAYLAGPSSQRVCNSRRKLKLKLTHSNTLALLTTLE